MPNMPERGGKIFSKARLFGPVTPVSDPVVVADMLPSILNDFTKKELRKLAKIVDVELEPRINKDDIISILIESEKLRPDKAWILMTLGSKE